METYQVVLLIAAPAAGLVCMVFWLRGRYGRIRAELDLEIRQSGEGILVFPEAGSFRGARSRYGRLKCDGVIAATDRRIVFRKLIGAGLEVLLADVVGLREDKWFLQSYRSGRRHLILQTRDGNEIGFLVRDNERWKRALGFVAPRAE